MRASLINKNLSFYYWLKKRIGKKWAFKVAIRAEKIILIFGREPIRDTKSRAHLMNGDRLLKIHHAISPKRKMSLKSLFAHGVIKHKEG